MNKILDIEVLRAVAIGYTLLAHFRFAYAQQPAWIAWLDGKAHFWGGVDLFFVISGFVISKNLIPQFRSLEGAELPKRLQPVFAFWVRRVYRLWPSSWLWAFVSLAVIAIGFPEQLALNVNDVIAALLQVYNFHAYACANGAPGCSHLSVGVYWSLSLEEQFYILLPLIFLVLGQRARWALWMLLAAGMAMSVVWPAPLGFFRWEAFCLGVLLAWAYANPAVRALAEEHLVAPLGKLTVPLTVLMLVAIPIVGHGTITNMPYPFLAICSAALVALACFDRNYLGIPRLLRAPLVYVGARSYSLYLIHMPVLIAFQRLSRDRTSFDPAQSTGQQVLAHALWIGAATVIMFILAELNFRFVESRFRRSSASTEPGAATLIPKPDSV